MKEINENELKDVTGGNTMGASDKKSIPSPAYGECPKGFVLKEGYCIPAEGVGIIPGLISPSDKKKPKPI